MKFSELKFEPHPIGNGIRATVFFKNDYGASVIKNAYSYGGPEGLYELVVLKGTPEKNHLCYDTPITPDVLGHLTEEDVEKILDQIKDLKQN